MHQFGFLALIAAASALLGWFLCGRVRHFLLKNDVLDRPNARSLHTVAVPRGGGLAIWLTVLPLWTLALAALDHNAGSYRFLISGTALLLVVSWLDDKKSLPVFARLSAQLAGIGLGLATLPESQMVFQGALPFWADRLLASFCWLWFVNLTNFMDGIDGLSGSESAHISLGFILVAALAGLPLENESLLAACLLGASLGFLTWNWHPAKLFMGDAGSVPMGYLLGYLLLLLACHGHLGIALTLPLYYVADASITLLRRIAEKKPFWQGHREHFYQKAALAVSRHNRVVIPVMIANAGLLLVCLLSLRFGASFLFAAPLIVGLLLWYLKALSTRA